MKLWGHKVRPKDVWVDIEYPPWDRGLCKELESQYRVNRDPAVRSKIVMQYAGVAITIVRQYANFCPDVNDLASEAMVAVCESVDVWVDRPDAILYYIVGSKVHEACRRYMETRHLVTIPQNKLESGFQPYGLEEYTGYEKHTVHVLGTVVANELVSLVCKNNTDRLIVKMKLAGNTNEEIAKALSVSRVTLSKYLGIIQERLAMYVVE